MYAANGAWASFVYLTGPISPILVEDLGVPKAWSGLIGTALALGITSASWVAPRVIRTLGRDGAIRAGLLALGAALGLTLLVPGLASGAVAFGMILVLIWLGATGGGTVVNASTARLSDAHPEHSARVITEANAIAAWVGVLSPLLLGAALGAGLGWSVGVIACVVAAAGALLFLVVADRRAGSTTPAGEPAEHSVHHDVEPALEPIVEPPGPAAPSAQSGPLPPVFWVAMGALFAATATEFAITYWGSTLVQEQTGATASAATAAMSAVVAGIAVGRTVGSALTARWGPHRMLLGGFALALVGFGILWSGRALPVAVVGLTVAGLGLATLFPLILDRGIALSQGDPDRAMARALLVLGIAIGTAPFALGALGSVVAVDTAMLLVPVIIVVGLVAVARSRPPGSAAPAAAAEKEV